MKKLTPRQLLKWEVGRDIAAEIARGLEQMRSNRPTRVHHIVAITVPKFQAKGPWR